MDSLSFFPDTTTTSSSSFNEIRLIRSKDSRSSASADPAEGTLISSAVVDGFCKATKVVSIPRSCSSWSTTVLAVEAVEIVVLFCIIILVSSSSSSSVVVGESGAFASVQDDSWNESRLLSLVRLGGGGGRMISGLLFVIVVLLSFGSMVSAFFSGGRRGGGGGGKNGAFVNVGMEVDASTTIIIIMMMKAIHTMGMNPIHRQVIVIVVCVIVVTLRFIAVVLQGRG
jgi:hypothetical protein